MDFSGKHVLVLGLGESGLAMSRWLLRCGAKLRVADTRTAPDRLAILTELSSEIEFIGAKFSLALLSDIDIVAVSPGLSPLNELAILLPEMTQNNIPLWGEVEIFALALAALQNSHGYQPKLIAITGTNGKTTVTSLVGLLCERAGLSVKLAGNISPAMLDVLREAIDADSLPQVWVLELSSFQLHTSYSLQADAATVLNISQDHLDWHGDLKSYCADKARIFGARTTQVLNRDDALVMAMHKSTPQAENKQLTFGVASPIIDGDLGLLNEHGMIWLAAANSAEEEQSVSRRKKKNIEEAPVIIARLMPADALKIRGLHNAANALAALALCRAIGLPLAPLLHGLREYTGEPHRVELVATIGGIDFIDDSKGTNVGATVAALKGLGAQAHGNGKRIILIAGGEGKGQDFSPLKEPLIQYAKAVFLIGKAADEMRQTFQTCQLELCDSHTLELAVLAAAELAQEGDIVLLSPACASFDMFRNYSHRAQVFVESVREFALNRGEIA
ncbi:UDP-N-acetylmuramoyl-L-alanine--D-glutamate ligase [Undibacterium sp. Ren11W]|uniref:UDP-N-acetylmuramoyl-L-alanine--D-glutamate ligase n=1 Tax=Undibacterium sp. Ren11W TaxID=3413045 RepID=UPI003BF2F3A2